ncbi:DUF7079 family protein [Sphingomonas crocodyli]|uniref:DUF7079 domain-containing protein n=1 Tax=Sphingomonas crocodyli TaxID=1979270 RepID=A0A437MAW5_9SPHN|nr:hypothetical protein [Sphingomonas crocodyli]RVT94794.1 hypothetical protein EOD43_13515 [Sphingomonas crocodyli]
MLTSDEIERRMPVWTALADLFLDAELDKADYRRIAGSVRTSGYDLAVVECILRDEVLPAFAFNLLEIAGEWAGWHEDDVRTIMTGAIARRPGIGTRIKKALLWRDIERKWRKIADIALSAE